MTSNYHSSHCDSDVRYPYTDRVALGEDYVDFVYQFVKDSNISTKNCKNTASISNIRNNIIGIPSNFPSHEDFLLERYNFDISISPWQKQVPYTFVPQYRKDYYFHQIDLEFHEAVYPIRISIYEVYNFGNVTEVWAQDSEDESRWILLWDLSPEFYEYREIERRRSGSRIFSPPLRSCNFKTKMFRLQFISNSCTQLDAVMLIGTSKLIFPKDPEAKSINTLLLCIRAQRHSCSKRFCSSCCSEEFSRFQQEQNNIPDTKPWNFCELDDPFNNTRDYENAYLDILDLQKEFPKYCVIYKSDVATNFHKSKLAHKQVSREEDMLSSKQGYHPLLRNHWNYVKLIEDIKLSSGESKEQLDSFSALSDEIILIILKYLDIRSFCRMSEVNKRFNNLTQDPFLFKCLNLRNLKKEYSKDSSFCYDKILFYFASKCKYLQQLDLTASCISAPDFVNFLQSCGDCLTHLRLSSCNFVDKLSLLKISEICKNLKVLDLSYCPLGGMDQEVSSLENLEFLEKLDLRWSHIRAKSLCKILQKTRRMRDLNLSTHSCWDFLESRIDLKRLPLDIDAIIIQLKNSCPDLEIIDLSGNIITSRGIHALAECKNLRKLTMMKMYCTIDKHNWHRLFSSCQCLEEVSLMNFNYDVYEGLTLCKNLRQIYLDYISSFAILEQCPKLQTIYVMRNGSDDTRDSQASFVAQAKEKYPHVSILEYQNHYIINSQIAKLLP